MGGSPHTCASFNPGGYRTVGFLQLISGDTLLSRDLGLASLNSWECLLHLVLPLNRYCFPPPQEMGSGFVFLGLASRAAAVSPLVTHGEAGLQLTWCRL